MLPKLVRLLLQEPRDERQNIVRVNHEIPIGVGADANPAKQARFKRRGASAAKRVVDNVAWFAEPPHKNVGDGRGEHRHV